MRPQLTETTCTCPCNCRALPKQCGRRALHRKRSTELQARQRQQTSCSVFDHAPPKICMYHFFAWHCMLLPARRRCCVLPCPVRNLGHVCAHTMQMQTRCYQHAQCTKTRAPALAGNVPRRGPSQPQKKRIALDTEKLAQSQKKWGPLGQRGCIKRGPVLGTDFSPPQDAHNTQKGPQLVPTFGAIFVVG